MNLPTLVTNCSNNYGPYHFPEKLIPHMIIKALAGKSFRSMAMARISATGSTWRITRERLRWYSERARLGDTYNIGGRNERTQPVRRGAHLRPP